MIAAIDTARSERTLKQVEVILKNLEALWDVEESEPLVDSIKKSREALLTLRSQLSRAVTEARRWEDLEVQLSTEGIAYRKELEVAERLRLVGNG